MPDLEQSVLVSLDGTDMRLFPYLPELLQDLDDLGADPELIATLLAEGGHLPEYARVLDLGCGKGSASLHLLQMHPWTALGLDGMPAFVERARSRAENLGLSERCRFEIADMRLWEGDGRFDVILLGAVGPVLGNTETTLRRLDTWLTPGGRVVVDEVYVPDGTSSRNEVYNQTRGGLLASIERAGFRILAEGHEPAGGHIDDHQAMFGAIRARAEALAERYSEHRTLFEAYLADQAREFEILKEEIVAVTLLLARS